MTSTGCPAIITQNNQFSREHPKNGEGVICNDFVRPYSLCQKPQGKEPPPRQKMKAGTDAPRMRDTDDTFDGNFVQPVRLHNHLLMLTVSQERIFCTNKKHSLSQEASTTCWLVSRGLIFQRISVQTGSDCVFSDPDRAFTLLLLCLRTWRVPLQNKTTQPPFHMAGWDLAQMESKIRIEKNIQYVLVLVSHIWRMHDVTRINSTYIYILNAAHPR